MILLSKQKGKMTEFYEVSEDDIVQALKLVGKIPKQAECSLVFNVPGGGDYSNMTLDIKDHPLKLKITY